MALARILVADCYRPLFELAVELYGTNIYAYYYDISFEETLERHKTRSNCYEFGEEAMKSWWVDKDYSEILNEAMITESQSKEEIV